MYISSNPSLPIGALLNILARKRSEVPVFSGPRVYEYSQVREAVADFVIVVKMKPGDSVLVPGYICSSVIDPFEKMGIKVIFYPVDQTLAPDAKAVRELLLQKPKAILIVHYFGFAARADAVIQECREHGVWILEDCAHTLPVLDGAVMGRLGDLTMFSLPKLLPVPDGAVIVVNNASLKWTEAPTKVNRKLMLANILWQTANTMEVLVGASLRTRLRDRRSATRMITALREPVVADGQPTTNGKPPSYHRFRMSPVAKWICRQIDLAAVTQRRQENYRWLKAALKSVKGARPVFGDLEPSGAPLGFPIIVEQRDAVRLKLIAAGVDPRPIWSGLPSQVPIAGFADTRYVAAHNIVLPVHQDLRPKALAHIVSALDRAIATSS
jgi:dTDP-4-amino-4,6-dideoxygalactose transaminase